MGSGAPPGGATRRRRRSRMKRRGTFRRQVKPLTSFGRRARVLSALAVFTFCALTGTANPDAHARAGYAHPTQTTLTPLQWAIERERQRLGSSDAEERRDAVLRLGAIARPESARVAATALPVPRRWCGRRRRAPLLSLRGGAAALLLPRLTTATILSRAKRLTHLVRRADALPSGSRGRART